MNELATIADATTQLVPVVDEVKELPAIDVQVHKSDPVDGELMQSDPISPVADNQEPKGRELNIIVDEVKKLPPKC